LPGGASLLNVCGEGDQKEVAGRWGRSPSPDSAYPVPAPAVPWGACSGGTCAPAIPGSLACRAFPGKAGRPSCTRLRAVTAAGRQHAGTNPRRPAVHIRAARGVRRARVLARRQTG